MKFAILIFGALLLSACGHGQGLLPKNQDSMVTENELLCLTADVSGAEAGLASFILGPLVKTAGGFIIDRISGAIEKESKLYKATYTARISERLLLATGKLDEKNNPTADVQLRVKSITFMRFAGPEKYKTCEEAIAAKNPAMKFSAKLVPEPGEGVFRVVPTEFFYNRSKSKVPAWDDKLDVNVQVQITAIVPDSEGKKSIVEMAKIDFPVGRTPVGKAVTSTDTALNSIQSDWVIIPAFAVPPAASLKQAKALGVVSFMVTVIEADELGDVLAKGSQKVKDAKGKVLDKIAEKLGLNE